jgi:hypothetical protein
MRDLLRSVQIPAQRILLSHIGGALFALMLLTCAALAAYPAHAQTANNQGKVMKHYALVFYLSSRTLTPEELVKRQIEIQEWAKKIVAMGIELDPRAFRAPLARLTLSQGTVASGNVETGPEFSNIVFFDTDSEEQAMQVAKTHPGLHYGTTVEVREWTPPQRTVATP